MEDLKNGLDEKALINFVKTCLLSGTNPRGEEAVKNLEWGIKQYRKHLILHGVSISLPSDDEIHKKADNWLPKIADKSYPKGIELRNQKRDGYILGMKHLRDQLKGNEY